MTQIFSKKEKACIEIQTHNHGHSESEVPLRGILVCFDVIFVLEKQGKLGIFSPLKSLGGPA